MRQKSTATSAAAAIEAKAVRILVRPEMESPYVGDQTPKTQVRSMGIRAAPQPITGEMTMHTKSVGLTLTLALLAGAGMAAERNGMTWGSYGHRASLGVDMVGCHGQPGPACDAYEGDTSCAAALPLLCARIDDSPRPNYKVMRSGGSFPDAFYLGWLGGHIATTLPVVGNTLTHPGPGDEPGNPNHICRQAFGPGWRIAEHHDGRWVPGMDVGQYYGNEAWNSPSPWPGRKVAEVGGWTTTAYGHVRSDTRFWVRVRGQNANCWNP